jgi:hypothetical protein
MVDINLMLVAYLLAVSGVATLVRFRDTPVTKIADVYTVLAGFVSCLVAGTVALFIQAETGADLYNVASFMMIAGSAVGGISTVSAAMSFYKKPTTA